MHSQNSKIEELVSRLGELLTPFDCVGVRLDYIVSGNGANRRCLVPERFGSGPRNAIISDRENMRPKGLKTLRTTFNIPESVGKEILDTALELSEINDMGAWAFSTDEREPRVAGQYSVGERGSDSLPGYAADMDNLRDALPQIHTIDIVTHTRRNAVKMTGRKAWFYFYDVAGEQVCAIALNHLAATMRDWLGDDEQKRIEADRRMGRWANQNNASRDRFIEASRILLQFDAYLEATKINLWT